MPDELNLDIDRKLNPYCPYCGNKCIPYSIEMEDRSGWILGWTCNCDQIKGLEENLEKGRI